jgi:phosphoribosyl 1,2-cyclic phosphate phosphodiesterase
MTPARLIVMGSGTSVGVPTIGCSCAVCRSEDPRDMRLRPSVAIEWSGRCIVIDTGPDFRQQAIRHRLPRVDAVLYTHAHADHILGLDDLRPFNFHQQEVIPIFSTAETLEVIQRVFQYIFHAGPSQSSRPKIKPSTFDHAAFEAAGLRFQPIPLLHGKGPCHGFRFGNTAYLTDHSEIPESSMDLLQNLDVLFLDALRFHAHPTHSTVAQSLATVERLRPKQTWFTHVSHEILHERDDARLPEGVHFAYDGLVVEICVEEAP